jgi:hypothetical protein
MIEENLDAFTANATFTGPPSTTAGPCWSWDRFGRSETVLPDGRTIYIGGEHEDAYDADFYIYNDVVVADRAGSVSIFGFTEDVFPPTDFHTATLVGDRVIVIGNLSYPSLRKGSAQVFVLDSNRYAFSHIQPIGAGPPWLHKHSARLTEGRDAIEVSGGLIADPKWPALVDNIDDWRLELDQWRWHRLTTRNWPQFIFARSDNAPNHLYWLRDLLKAGPASASDGASQYRDERLRDLGPTPRIDLVEALYAPDVPHSRLAEKPDEFRVHRLIVNEATVRYTENDFNVQMIVEGRLSDELVERLRRDLLNKLEAIEGIAMKFTAVRID